jgi:hypothetical protein
MRQSIHPLGDTTYHFVKANVLNAVQDEEIGVLKSRIKRLEEAGDEAICPLEYASRVRIWTKAKDSQ